MSYIITAGIALLVGFGIGVVVTYRHFAKIKALESAVKG